MCECVCLPFQLNLIRHSSLLSTSVSSTTLDPLLPSHYFIAVFYKITFLSYHRKLLEPSSYIQWKWLIDAEYTCATSLKNDIFSDGQRGKGSKSKSASGEAWIINLSIFPHLELWWRIDHKGVRCEHFEYRSFSIRLNDRSIDQLQSTPHFWIPRRQISRDAIFLELNQIIYIVFKLHKLFTVIHLNHNRSHYFQRKMSKNMEDIWGQNASLAFKLVICKLCAPSCRIWLVLQSS